MSMKNYTSGFSTKKTPQSQPIPGREKDMTKNSAGGYSFKVDRWTQLNRFLILGTEGGTYYASQPKLTAENAKVALDCVAEDGVRVVNTVVEISDQGRAPRNTAAIFVLALAAKLGDEPTKVAAYKALPKVCRIGTHLFQWMDAIKAFGGFSSGTQRALARWYQDMPVHRLALQVVKYQQRDGWSHKDVLRLAKPGSKGRKGDRDPRVDTVLNWVTKGTAPAAPEDGIELLWAFEKAKAIGVAGDVSAARTKEIIGLINEYRLPRECIPTQYLNQVGVWEALLDNGGRGMPMTAMIRNLPKMTSLGLFSGKGGNTRLASVTSRLKDEETLRKARIHPMSVLVAMRTYGSGRGIRGSLTWSPVSKIVDALDGAFYKSFQNVESTGKRWLLALDVSGSMSASVMGMPGINCRDASAAMAMVTAAAEDNTHVIGFTSGGKGHFTSPQGNRWSNTYYGGRNQGVSELDISPRRRLDDNVRSISSLPFGGTDCALPMIYALERGVEADVFVVYTDSETWSSPDMHPVQALREYRQKMGIDAKLIVVGMASNGFSIADPSDAGMLDLVGMDTAAPNIMSQFALGNV